MNQLRLAVIGTGRLGAALAFKLAFEPYVDELILVDIIPKLAYIVREDIYHGLVLHGIDLEILAYGDVSQIRDADMILITAGSSRRPGMSRRDLVKKNFEIVGKIIESVYPNNEDSWYIIITNPVDAVATYVSMLTKSERVIGTGTCLETARLRKFLAEALDIAISGVDGYVGGEHGEEAVVLWSTISIDGKPLESYLRDRGVELDLKQIESYVRNISTEIIKIQGATIWGPTGAFVELVRGIALNTGRILSFSMSHEFKEIPIPVHVSIPAKIGRRVGFTIWDRLLESEKSAIVKAAKIIYDTYRAGRGL